MRISKNADTDQKGTYRHKRGLRGQGPVNSENGAAPIQMKRASSPLAPTGESQAPVKRNDLPSSVLGKMEHSFGEDFSGVKIHQNSSRAQGMGALAFTQGEEVHFAPGTYEPHSLTGQQLIGHELAHVVQQRGGGNMSNLNTGSTNETSNNHLEHEADMAGVNAAKGSSVAVSSVSHPTMVQMSPDHDFTLKGVIVSPVSLRTDPSFDSGYLSTLPVGTKLLIDRKNRYNKGQMYYVRALYGSSHVVEGYVSANTKYVSVIGEYKKPEPPEEKRDDPDFKLYPMGEQSSSWQWYGIEMSWEGMHLPGQQDQQFGGSWTAANETMEIGDLMGAANMVRQVGKPQGKNLVSHFWNKALPILKAKETYFGMALGLSVAGSIAYHYQGYDETQDTEDFAKLSGTKTTNSTSNDWDRKEYKIILTQQPVNWSMDSKVGDRKSGKMTYLEGGQRKERMVEYELTEIHINDRATRNWGCTYRPADDLSEYKSVKGITY